jgi:hypothetical protein
MLIKKYSIQFHKITKPSLESGMQNWVSEKIVNINKYSVWNKYEHNKGTKY